MNSIENKIRQYYLKYYKLTCSLPDYEERITQRLIEEETELAQLRHWERITGITFFGKSHFVFGLGTAGLCVALKKGYNAEVSGIEPNLEALSIVHDKCASSNLIKDNFRADFGEKLSFADSQFDIVHCHSVLEHVQNVDLCLDEMIRITKPGGKILISTPNYSYPYERHYKIPFPTFLPKWVGGIYLRILGKSPQFLHSINYISDKYLLRLLIKKRGISWAQYFEPIPPHKTRLGSLWNFVLFRLGIYPQHKIVITRTT